MSTAGLRRDRSLFRLRVLPADRRGRRLRALTLAAAASLLLVLMGVVRNQWQLALAGVLVLTFIVISELTLARSVRAARTEMWDVASSCPDPVAAMTLLQLYTDQSYSDRDVLDGWWDSQSPHVRPHRSTYRGTGHRAAVRAAGA